MHADRTNRTMLLLLAVVLIAAGGLGGAVSLGVFGRTNEHATLLANRVATYFGDHGDWLWPAVGLVAAILVVLALRWLLTLLFSTDRAGDLSFRSDGAGRTTLSGGAVTDAVAQEIETYRGVSSARARLIGDSEDPTLVVTATLENTADFAGLRRRIETGALAHARTAVGNPTLPTQLDLTVTTRRAARVT